MDALRGDDRQEYLRLAGPAFQAVQEWFSKQTITETKGVFSDIEEHNLGDVANYADMRVKGAKFASEPTQEELSDFKKAHPKGWVEKRKLKAKKDTFSHWKRWNISENLNVLIGGFKFDFGTGGLHGSLSNAIVKSDDDYIIIDYDVASYYPNLAIANRVLIA